MKDPNTLILRRYGVGKVLRAIDKHVPGINLGVRRSGGGPPVPKGAGIPIHEHVAKAMFDAAHESGAIPAGIGGEEASNLFSKYKGMVHKELSDPTSPFTKMFNRHKREATQVPNPREHLKKALLPLFQRFANPDKFPSRPPTPVSNGEDEQIDLLGGEHHPHEESGGGFEFHPRLPSGFVELPPKAKRTIKNPALPTDKRKGVYQTIAHALANKEDVHQALNREHGFDQTTATKHYNNFLKNKNRPQGVIRPENQTQLPRKGGTGQGGMRRRKFDRTDLMAIPVQYASRPRPQQQTKPKTPKVFGASMDDIYADQRGDDTHEITIGSEVVKPKEAKGSVDKEPIQKSAYKAPAGGAIVRGTQYKGGEMLPDMRGSFMNPRRAKMSRELKRYSTSSSHTEDEFHRKIDENPQETTSHLAYADWLDENGKPGLAEVIRRAKGKGFVHPVGNERQGQPFAEDEHGFGSYLTVNYPMLHDSKKRLVYGINDSKNKSKEYGQLVNKINGEISPSQE